MAWDRKPMTPGDCMGWVAAIWVVAVAMGAWYLPDSLRLSEMAYISETAKSAPRFPAKVTSVSVERKPTLGKTRRYRAVIEYTYANSMGQEVRASTDDRGPLPLRTFSWREGAQNDVSRWRTGSDATIAVVDGKWPVFEPDARIYDWNHLEEAWLFGLVIPAIASLVCGTGFIWVYRTRCTRRIAARNA